MSKFEIKIQPIFISEHKNAERLEIGHIGSPEGWQVVIAKDRFFSGDLCAYIGENAVVPEEILKYYGYWNTEKDKGLLAGSKGDRVKAVRLRDEFSLGIVLPVVECKDGWYKFPHTPEDQLTGYFKLDEDVSEILGVTKYEPPIPVCMAGEVYNAGTHVGVNYDIENIKKFTSIFVEGEEVQVTEKIHGCADYHTIITTVEHGDIKIGEFVERHLSGHVKTMELSTGEIQYNEVLGWSAQENNGDWYLLETEDRSQVKLTGNHPVWIPSIQAYRRVDELLGTEDVMID